MEIEKTQEEQVEKDTKRRNTVEESVDATQKEPKKKKKALWILIVLCSLIVIALIVLCVSNRLNSNVYHNVYFENINMSGKTPQQVKSFLEQFANNSYNKSVVIYNNDKLLLEITAEDLGLKVNNAKSEQEILSFGRNGNILVDNIDIIKANFSKKEFTANYDISQAKVAVIVDKILSLIENKVSDDKFQVVENQLVITKGTKGNDIDKETFINDLANIIIGDTDTTIKYNLNVFERTPKPLDVDVVYASVYKEAKDAKVDETKKPAVYTSHEYGMSFDKEKLRNVLSLQENNVEGKEIKFDLDVIQPEVKLGDLKWELYSDLLGTYTTSFDPSAVNRAHNIKVAANYIDGTIVMPGEVFSFNNTVGDCGSEARGFKMSTIYAGGKVEMGMGGGVCQVSSTLYNTVLYANLDIVYRTNHGYTVSYVPGSRDATIYYPYIDFKFKNSRNYPIKIVTSYNSSGKLTMSIYGTKEDNEYEVVLESYILSYIYKGTTYVNDDTLEIGKQVTDTIGQNGYKSIAYKVLKKNGKVVSKTVLSTDSYSAMNDVIKVGTKKVEVDPYQE
ncbi:MAG: VanW family protein [Clostridia bacterium]|nr:VanW family protein [Clostridia bacterium]